MLASASVTGHQPASHHRLVTVRGCALVWQAAIDGRISILGHALQLALEKRSTKYVRLLLEHAQQPPSGRNVREALRQVPHR